MAFFLSTFGSEFNSFIFEILILLVVLMPLFKVDGGLVDDDYYYIKIAESLPNFNISVFPIFAD